MFRFKLRTLLIATALVAVPFGLQVHVHMKAKRFVEQMKATSLAAQKRLLRDVQISPEQTMFWTTEEGGALTAAVLRPFSLTDVVLFRRRCRVTFIVEFGGDEDSCAKQYYVDYWLHTFGEGCELTQVNHVGI